MLTVRSAALFEMLVGAPNLPPGDDFERFRLMCFHGIPDSGSLRPQAWRLLLGILPFSPRADWQELLSDMRTSYYAFLGDLVPPPDADLAQSDAAFLDQIDMDVRRTLPDIAFFQTQICLPLRSPLHPHNVSDQQSSAVPTVANRRSLFTHLKRIRRDNDFGVRTRMDSEPISEADEHAPENAKSESVAPPVTHVDLNAPDMHWEAVERILFLYAKLNPGIGYVQGMNELLAPIYYVLANDPDEESKMHAEADAFFMFTALMSEFRDHFIRSLDNMSRRSSKMSLHSNNSFESVSLASVAPKTAPTRSIQGPVVAEPAAMASAGDDVQRTGIGESLSRLMRRLQQVDPELHRDLRQKRIEPIFFAFRWISVLFTQEFPLPDVIRIWDALLADVAVDINDYALASQNKLAASSASLANLLSSKQRGADASGSKPVLASGGATDAFAISGPQPPPARGRQNKFEFTIDFACAMVTCVRDQILSSSFSENLKLLQSYPLQDVETILARAWRYHTSESNSAAITDLHKKNDQYDTKKLAPTIQSVAAFTNLFKRASFGITNRSVPASSTSTSNQVGAFIEEDADTENQKDIAVAPSRSTPAASGSATNASSNVATSLFAGLGIKASLSSSSTSADTNASPNDSGALRMKFANINIFSRSFGASEPTAISKKPVNHDIKSFALMSSTDLLNDTENAEHDVASTGTPADAPIETKSEEKQQEPKKSSVQSHPTISGFAKFIRAATIMRSTAPNRSATASNPSHPFAEAAQTPDQPPPGTQSNSHATSKPDPFVAVQSKPDPTDVSELVWQSPLSNEEIIMDA